MKNWKEFISAIVPLVIVCLISTTIIILESDISRLNSRVKNLETQQYFYGENQKILFSKFNSNTVIDSVADSISFKAKTLTHYFIWRQ